MSEHSPTILFLVTFIGAFTSFFAAPSGAFQHDSKRVIAYSTCSQSGYMVFARGISSYSVTMFHLMNHAFLKALSSLSAGSIIHALNDEQDMRRMGGLNRVLPFTYTMTLIGSLALIGFPFLTGYYPKDFILELARSRFHITGNIAYWLGIGTASLTTFHSYRLLFVTYINKNQSFKTSLMNAHEPSIYISLPLATLAFGSIFIGYITKDMIIGLGTGFRGQSIVVLAKNNNFIEAEYSPYHIKLIPFIFSHIGLWIAYNTTSYAPSEAHYQKGLDLHEITRESKLARMYYRFFSRSWGFDDIYNRFLVQKFPSFGYSISSRLFDAGWITFLGPYGISKTIQKWSYKIGNIQSGYVYHYAFIMLISAWIYIFTMNAQMFGPIDYIFLSVFFYSTINS